MKGTIVGSYRILDAISVGGMGTVYRAEHTLIGRLAAVKILHPELCSNRDIVGRFFTEAKTTTSIKHPGIVEIFDFGYMESGHAYLIMELLDGAPLSHRVRARGPISEGEAAVVLRGVCIALSAAHDKGVVHRDLKPDNIFVIPDPDSRLGERTKILDFGIAKLTDIGLAGTATKTGAVMGTPTYMSPEQCRGTGDVDFRADLYSIGCMFYELVTGRPPFINTGAGELIGSHLFVEPERPSRHVAGLSAETEALIMALLAKQPEQRVQTAKELAQILAGIALQHGWMTPGDLSHPSLSHIVVPPLPAGQLGYGRPAYTPATLLAPTLTPTGGPPALPPPTLLTDKPTTLSGAASQIQLPVRSRRRLGIAIGGGLAAAVAGIALFVALSGPRSSSPATQPSVVAPATPAVPARAAPPAVTAPRAVTTPRAATPAVPPPAVTTTPVPQPAATPPVVTTPRPATPAAPPPAVTTTPVPQPAATPPAAPITALPAKPTTTPQPATTPARATPAAPASPPAVAPVPSTKPIVKPRKPVKTPGDLLEQDI